MVFEITTTMGKLVLLLFISHICGLCAAWEVVNSVKKGHMSITASTNYLWSTNGAQKIFRCVRPCSGTWVSVPGALMQVDASDEEVWGVDKGNNIYKRAVDGSGNWRKISGSLKHVSASGNGYIWGVNRHDHIYKCKKPCTGQWKNVGGRLSQVDGGFASVYGVNSGGTVYSTSIDGSKGWRHIHAPARMKHVTASGKDEIFATSRQGDVYRCKKPCIGEWEKMATEFNQLNQLDGAYDALFGVTNGGAILRHKTGK